MLSRSSITECREFDYLIRDGSLEREAIDLELLREGTMMRPQWVSGSRPDVLRTLPLFTDVSHSILTYQAVCLSGKELLSWCIWNDCKFDYKISKREEMYKSISGAHKVIPHGGTLNFPEVSITPAPLWWLSESKCK